MTFPRIYKTTTEAALRSCAGAGMTMEEAAAHLGVCPRGIKHTVSVLGIKFHGRYKQKQYRPAAHNPFSIGVQA